ncbi:MAG: hypothetical protein R2799_14585 [Crocinitomicaceae bacterium]
MKNLSIALFLTINLSGLYSQSDIGISAGVNFSKLYQFGKEEAIKNNFRTSSNGLFIQLHYTEFVASFARIGLGFGLSQNVMQYDLMNSFDDYDISISHQTNIEISWMNLFVLTKGKPFVVEIGLSPYFTVELIEKNKEIYHKYVFDTDSLGNPLPSYSKQLEETELKYSSNLYDFNFGLATRLNLGYLIKEQFLLSSSVDYKIGFLNTTTANGNYQMKPMHFAFQLGIAYRFKKNLLLKKRNK